ncbi:MAG: VCBS repeat-containing protein [Thermoplasmata archaeon]|nr:MAG: VCBS repeat-containing protein [Thermoplasmata archaeon]
MRSRPLAAAALVLVLMATVVPGPMGTPLASADPIKPTQLHVETFSDGSEELIAQVSTMDHAVANITVPAGSRILSATVNVSRVQYSTSEMPLDAAPRALWCGDLDRDGMDDDLLVAFPEEGRVDLYSLAGHPPSLALRRSLAVPDATAVTVDDLDRDNDKDVLVTSGSTGRLYVFETLSVDTFAEPRIIPVGLRPSDVTVKDLDPDFRRDVVVANSGGSSVTVLHGRGDLAFYPRLDEMGNGPVAVHLRDMDKDLDVDLVVAESRNDTVAVWYNEGNGNFSNVTSLPTGVGPVDIDVADLNGDSLVDIAVACSGSNEVWVYGQQPDGEFLLVELLPVGKAPRAVMGMQANELDDRNPDVVTVCSGSDNLTIYLAGGDLMHTVPVDVPVGGRPVAMAVVERNGDEADMMVVACQHPPSLVLVEPFRLAEMIKVGFSEGGNEDRIDLPFGTDAVTLPFTSALSSYVLTHHGEARLGMLNVHMEVWATSPGVVRLRDLDVWVQVNRPPRADAGRNVTVDVGEPAELNGSASYDPDGGFIEFMWLLPGSDGAAHTDRVSYHVWMEPGTYPILLIARDQWGLADQDQVYVIVNAPPVAKGVVPDTVRAREPVRLSAHLSEDPDGQIVDYVWDYSQGVVHGRSVDVVFTGTGTWNVTLMVIDDMDSRAVAVYQVDVLEAATPLREPAQRPPDDRGEVPGPGALLSTLAILGAALLAYGTRRMR